MPAFVYHPRILEARSGIRMRASSRPLAVESSPRTCTARRRLVGAAAALVAAPLLAIPRQSRANADALRTLSLRHTHTGESLRIDYAQGEAYVTAALARVNWFLRDFRNDESRPIDPQLLDQLHQLARLTRTNAPYEVISGYRSPATNDFLRRHGGGVAEHSLHLEGRAIDIRLADVPLADLRDAAASLRAGGVGFYPQSQFVHVDTGRVRHW
ncbi:MAG TPA: DUF882 domain-containing protein [Casimicrobiaceae bacterium]|nr:DUF882 domain-containing protein [Casimicrobiaceae bacterium]